VGWTWLPVVKSGSQVQLKLVQPQDKVTKKWEDRGRGNLTLRRAKQQPGDSGPTTPFLVFTMESGRST
jgi:hypothetical protein